MGKKKHFTPHFYNRNLCLIQSRCFSHQLKKLFQFSITGVQTTNVLIYGVDLIQR